MMQSFNDGLEAFKWNCFPAEDGMHLFYVSQRLLGRQVHSLFHTIKQEADHLICGIKVSLALDQLFLKDRLFPAIVVGNQWGWE